MSSDSSRSITAANPFQRAASTSMLHGPPHTAQSTSGNPFLAQLAKKEKPAPTPFGEHFVVTDPVAIPPTSYQPTQSLVLPPSYASVVSGKGAGQGSVPGFITHGPSSIPLAPKPEEGTCSKIRTTFLLIFIFWFHRFCCCAPCW